MGLSNSTAKTTEDENIANIKKLFKDEDNTEDILESLNITEFHVGDFNNNQNHTNTKKQIPLLGGNLNFQNNNTQITNSNQRRRYTKYDLFQMLREMDSEYQVGGNDDETKGNEDLSDDQAMEHIRNVILRELENLKTNKAEQLGGDCGCNGVPKPASKNQKFLKKNVVISDDNGLVGGNNVMIDSSSSTSSSSASSSSPSSLEEYGKGKKKGRKTTKGSKKNKSNKKVNNFTNEEAIVDDSDSSKFFIETSESGNEIKSKKMKKGMKKNIPLETSNGDKDSSSSDSEDKKKLSDDKEESEEGLSIFPFNSSDVKSSLSVKNYRMLRRKI